MRIVSIPSLHVIPVGDLSAARPLLEHADQLGHAVPRLRVGELAAVRRHDHVRELVEGAADARRPAALVAEPLALEHRVVVPHVEPGAAELAVPQRGVERRLLHHAAAADVDEQRAHREQRELPRADQRLGVGGAGQADDEDKGAAQQRVQVGRRVDGGDAVEVRPRGAAAAGEHVHAEPLQRLCDSAAHRAVAEHERRAAAEGRRRRARPPDRPARRPRLLPAERLGPQPRVPRKHALGRGEQQADGELTGRLRVEVRVVQREVRPSAQQQPRRHRRAGERHDHSSQPL
mmetsp:Transcript_23407/g.75484  ORF Transcript_23407/g.75484 Transcript_23407/m.75484 type:complete len:290 (-) Transcript_23407:301-1170(-)